LNFFAYNCFLKSSYQPPIPSFFMASQDLPSESCQTHVCYSLISAPQPFRVYSRPLSLPDLTQFISPPFKPPLLVEPLALRNIASLLVPPPPPPWATPCPLMMLGPILFLLGTISESTFSYLPLTFTVHAFVLKIAEWLLQ